MYVSLCKFVGDILVNFFKQLHYINIDNFKLIGTLQSQPSGLEKIVLTMTIFWNYYNTQNLPATVKPDLQRLSFYVLFAN
jgi:hypothetical protein